MNLEVSNVNFGSRVKMAQEPPKINQVSEKLQKIVKNATNQELLAAGTSASAVSEAALATKFPFIASGIAGSNAGLASSMFIDAKAVRKQIAGKDSLIKVANEKIMQQEKQLAQKTTEIAYKDELIEKQQQELAKMIEARKATFWGKLFRTSLWSK